MAAAEAPPPGPGSGFLVVVDEAAVEQAPTCCWGLCRDPRVRSLPFPQSQQLSLKQDDTPHPAETALDCASEILDKCFNISGPGKPPGTRNVTAPDYAVFVPVVGEPLSSHRYYVVRADGKHTGKVSACSREEDKTTCCFCSITNDVPPRSFDRGDVYQQVEVQQLAPGKNGFRAVAVAGDGVPPDYLRKKKGWKVVGMASPTYDLADDAQGVDAVLRSRMPEVDGETSSSSPPVVVGRWYVPFLFVKADGERRLKDQFRRCTFYEMTLEQSWEQIYSRQREREGPAAGEEEEVTVTAAVRRFTALLGGTDAVQPQADGGVMWFRPPAAGTMTAVGVVGLDMVLWERMRWEVDKGGWVAAAAGNGEGGGELERIERVERRDGGSGKWRRFGCYLLVERFVLRRTDGSVALASEFRFTNKIRANWV
ncbi:hypothetical protein U9M48_000904 [Paspalum notatum var. saurae]|uniref:Uncharacterized protein n=1 Tax=Paspalum notatum var. saurae TaxID=547442 RepID=A0AAQ3PL01_PASNO